MRSWALGTEGDDWVSMGVLSDGSYDIAEGLIYSFPCRCTDGEWRIVQGVEVGEFSRAKMSATEQELTEERDAVQHLLTLRVRLAAEIMRLGAMHVLVLFGGYANTMNTSREAEEVTTTAICEKRFTRCRYRAVARKGGVENLSLRALARAVLACLKLRRIGTSKIKASY